MPSAPLSPQDRERTRANAVCRPSGCEEKSAGAYAFSPSPFARKRGMSPLFRGGVFLGDEEFHQLDDLVVAAQRVAVEPVLAVDHQGGCGGHLHGLDLR